MGLRICYLFRLLVSTINLLASLLCAIFVILYMLQLNGCCPIFSSTCWSNNFSCLANENIIQNSTLLSVSISLNRHIPFSGLTTESSSQYSDSASSVIQTTTASYFQTNPHSSSSHQAYTISNNFLPRIAQIASRRAPFLIVVCESRSPCWYCSALNVLSTIASLFLLIRVCFNIYSDRSEYVPIVLLPFCHLTY